MPLLQDEGVIATFIGAHKPAIIDFLAKFPKQDYFIMKPLDLYQGLGVQKLHRDDEKFWDKIAKGVQDFSGTLVLQPFLQEIKQGELRAVYYNGKELSSIIKIPKEGSFLANIAQGAKYELYKLDEKIAGKCQKMADKLLEQGVNLVAFDILAGKISEANITCPGLLVEVSNAAGKNLTLQMLN